MLKTAVIIAGGEGTRLMPLTADRPKTLVEVAGKPMLQWILEWLKAYGINHVVIGVAHRKEKIIDFVRTNDGFGMKVDFSGHTLEGGTAQGFKLAISRHVDKDDKNFLAMNGDELTNMNIINLYDTHMKTGAMVTHALSPLYCRFSIVEKDPNDRAKAAGFVYGKKLDIHVSMGIYMFNRDIVDRIPDTGSIEELVFKPLASEGKLGAHYITDTEHWVSVNSIKDVKEGSEEVLRWASGDVSPRKIVYK